MRPIVAGTDEPYEALLVDGTLIVWQCGHWHPTRCDALVCAESEEARCK